MYADVLPALERWTGLGKKVSIYSSGSREVSSVPGTCQGVDVKRAITGEGGSFVFLL